MGLDDERYDPLYQQMVAAWEGDAEPWRRVNVAMRDAMVDHAVRTAPYYRSLGARAFERLPLLTKDVIRERGPDLLAEGVPEDRRVPVRSSGSTGEAIAFWRDSSQGPAEDYSARRILRRLHGVPDCATMVWISSNPIVRPHDLVPEPGGWGRVVRRLRRRSGPPPRVVPVQVTPAVPADVPRLAALWSGVDEYFVYGVPSTLEWFADAMEAHGVTLPRPPICVVTTAEMVTPLASSRIGAVFGCPVHSWYGAREFNGYLAGTLPGTGRYAFNPLLVYLEVVDDDGRPVPPGATGRLVLTDLRNHVFPLIRYDIGDLATAATEPSLNGWPVVDSIDGRDGEMLLFPSGRHINSSQLGLPLYIWNDHTDVLRRCQIAMVADNALEVRCVWVREPTDRDLDSLRVALRTLTDPDTEIRFRSIERIERLPSGKVWQLRDER